jgi:Mn2+/Fe2+ NRAMP family transporter
MRRQKQSRNTDLWRYAGLGMQIFVSLGIAVFIGFKLDKWLNTSIPLFVWIIPFSVLCLMMYKLIKETSKANTGNEE